MELKSSVGPKHDKGDKSFLCFASTSTTTKRKHVWLLLRLNTSLGYPWLTTGIPVGKPAGMETHGSELLVVTGLHGSGCLVWVLRVLATSTCKT